MIKSITDKTVAKEASKGYTLLDMWASWCGPCRGLSIVLQNLANKRKDIKFVKLDIDENQELPKKLGVKAIPTIVLYHDGKIVARHTGAMTMGQLNKWLDSNMKK